MDCSLDDVLQHLRQWKSSAASVRVFFSGRGLKLRYSPGRITEVSGARVTVVAESCHVEFDTGVNSRAQLFSRDSSEIISADLEEFFSSDAESMLVLEGALKDILVILKMKERVSVSKVTTPGSDLKWMS